MASRRRATHRLTDVASSADSSVTYPLPSSDDAGIAGLGPGEAHARTQLGASCRCAHVLGSVLCDFRSNLNFMKPPEAAMSTSLGRRQGQLAGAAGNVLLPSEMVAAQKSPTSSTSSLWHVLQLERLSLDEPFWNHNLPGNVEAL